MSRTDNETFAQKWVREAPKGAEVYLILRHVSSSGMNRVIDMIVWDDGQPRYLRSLEDDPRFPFKLHPKIYGFKVGGTGMDMGFHLVYTLGQAFKDDGYYFTHRWL